MNWTLHNLPACFLVGSAGEKTRAFWVEDSPDSGPARRRARFSRALREWPSITTGPVGNQTVDRIMDFYTGTCARGVRPFLFPVPRRTGAPEMAYVRFSSEPEIVPVNSRLYNVTFGLEEV